MTGKPQLTLTSVTIGAQSPRDLSAFYARLLSAEITGVEDDWCQIRTAGGLTVNFECEREFARPVWPSQPEQQNATQHLDIWAPDLVASSAWAVECGAELADIQPQGDVRVFLDPEGHPFCLFTEH